MRPIHIVNIEMSYQKKIDKKKRQFSQMRAGLYRLDKLRRSLTPDDRKAFQEMKNKYKNQAAKSYQEALHPLINRIGNYCCYCERKCISHLAIEHKCPKDVKDNWNLILDWHNFLLSCPACNSKKGNSHIVRSNIFTILFPDKDNTYHIFSYKEEKNYSASLNTDFITNPLYYARAKQTLKMLKLNESEDINDTATRCYERLKKAKDAKTWLKVITENGIKQTFLNLIQSGVQEGCWSIWMQHFEHIPEIKEVILFALPNTAVEYFIDNYWEHEQYFKEYHSTTSYFNRLITILKSRISYIKSHQTKLSQIQKDGIFEWMIEFIANVKQKVTFTQDQLIRIQGDVNELKSL